MDKCPYCGSGNIHPVKPEKGNGYVIIEADTKTHQIYHDYALPVQLYGCLDCKSVLMKCESLEKR